MQRLWSLFDSSVSLFCRTCEAWSTAGCWKDGLGWTGWKDEISKSSRVFSCHIHAHECDHDWFPAWCRERWVNEFWVMKLILYYTMRAMPCKKAQIRVWLFICIKNQVPYVPTVTIHTYLSYIPYPLTTKRVSYLTYAYTLTVTVWHMDRALIYHLSFILYY